MNHRKNYKRFLSMLRNASDANNDWAAQLVWQSGQLKLVHTLRDDETLRESFIQWRIRWSQPITVVLDQVGDLDDANIEFDPVRWTSSVRHRIPSC